MAEIPNIPAGTVATQKVEPNAQSNSATNITVSSPTNQTVPSTSLQLPGTTVIPGLAKDLKIGETINFVLRGRSPDGQGLLYLLGQLVKANVPENIAIGDRVKATIERQGEKLLFKILNIDSIDPKSQSKPQQAFTQQLPTISIPERLEKQISHLLFQIAPFLPDETLSTHAPVHDLKVNLNLSLDNQSKEINAILSEIKKLFISDNKILQPSNIIQFLKTTNSVDTIEKTKELLTKINLIVAEKTGSPEQRFFANIVKELKALIPLIQDISNQPKFKVEHELEKLFKVLSNELDQESLGKTTKKNSLYFDTIKVIRGEILDLKKEGSELSQKNIEKLIDTLTSLQPDSKTLISSQNFNPNQIKELLTLYSSLEQFVKTTEILRQIEPLMNMMQAPELILFPFLFQGLLSFGEVVIDPNAHRNKQQQNPKKEDSSEEDEGNSGKPTKSSAFKYTTSIELPNLGFVSISSLQEKNEIDIRINTEDEEKRNFLESRLFDLKNELAQAGISSRDILLEILDISDSIVIE